ncbi:hypothetical protein MY8738_008244 [Beauveria namnaoensis]
MSALQNRKRPNPDGTAQDSPPTKRIKSDSAVQVASNFPPEFWDSLSKVWLTPRALREKDRRNSLRSPAAPIIKTAATLARFARRGGPDLGHLRGYPEPEHTAEMNPNRSSVPSTRRTKSTNATNGPPKVKRSSAYDRDFEQKLVDWIWLANVERDFFRQPKPKYRNNSQLQQWKTTYSYRMIILRMEVPRIQKLGYGRTPTMTFNNTLPRRIAK